MCLIRLKATPLYPVRRLPQPTRGTRMTRKRAVPKSGPQKVLPLPETPRPARSPRTTKTFRHSRATGGHDPAAAAAVVPAQAEAASPAVAGLPPQHDAPAAKARRPNPASNAFCRAKSTRRPGPSSRAGSGIPKARGSAFGSNWSRETRDWRRWSRAIIGRTWRSQASGMAAMPSASN